MADDADLTQARLEREMDYLLRQRRPAAALPDTGRCHWCGEATHGGRRFCDADCRDDWERAHSRRTALMGDRHT